MLLLSSGRSVPNVLVPLRTERAEGTLPESATADPGGTVGRSVSAPEAAAGNSRPRRRNLTGPLAIVHGALVGIGGIYLATHSVLITLIGAVAAVLLFGMALVFG